ncbi:MAG: ExeM/NucH family extracellular endonuclease [Anaerolineales bacterium]|nr:ExeM/NucH family extracellular endonuclease [Anaerolineales bacterium]
MNHKFPFQKLYYVTVLIIFILGISGNSIVFAQTPAIPIINEFVFNHTGTDTNEFVEIFGAADTDYSAYTLLEIEGDGSGAGTIDGVWTLGTTDGSGYWLVGYLNNEIENGTVTLLLVEGFSGSAGDDLDAENDGVVDSPPWTAIVDEVGVNDGDSGDFNYGGTVLAGGFDGDSFDVGGASRIPNGTDTDTTGDWVRNDYDGAGLPDYPDAVAPVGAAINTPGAENAVAEEQPPETPPAVINEFVFNHTGADTNEYVEVSGVADTDYSAYTLLEIEGDGSGTGTIDGVWTLDTTDGSGYWTTGILDSAFENGTVTLLLVEGFSGSNGDDLDTDNDGVVDSPPWTEIVDEVGVNDGDSGDFNYGGTVLGVGYDGQSYHPGGASRIPNGTDTDSPGDWVRNDFDGAGLPDYPAAVAPAGLAINTPGAENAVAADEPQTPDAVINEFVFNHTGSDTNEYVEIFGAADTDYSAYTLLEIEGEGTGAGTIDGVWTLGTTDASGYWTTGILNGELENGTLTLLLVEGFSGSAGDDVDGANDGVVDNQLWTAVVDGVGVNDDDPAEFNYGGTVLLPGFDGGAFTVGGASRIPNGTDTDSTTDWVRNDYEGAGLPDYPGVTALPGEAINTPGAENAVEADEPQTPGAVINEFVFNHTGTDTNEFVEIFGEPNTDYSAYTLLEIEGDDNAPGVIDDAWTLGTTDASGYWMVGFFNNTIENGTVTLLLVEGYTGTEGSDLDADDDGVFDSPPWTAVIDAVGVYDGGAADFNYGDPVLVAGFDGGSFTVGGASRIPNGTDNDVPGDWVRNDFDGAGLPDYPSAVAPVGAAINTPGAENAVMEAPPYPDFGACADPATLIHDVQGAGFTSPLAGEIGVILEGVVVGDFQTGSGLSGFFLQEEDADSDADVMTSEGIFVYDGYFGVDVNVGDVVRVQGTITEYYGLTELNDVLNLAVCGSGAAVTPVSVTLPIPSIDEWEYAEGMLVTIPQTLYATENYDLGRYGEVSVSVNDRLYNPTNVVAPGPDAIALQELNDRSRILLDDGSNYENPVPLPPYFTPDGTLRGGDSIPGITGVLSYGYSAYRLQPVGPVVFERLNERTATPQFTDGSLTVASFNVLNYFNGDGMGGGFPTSRGAGTLDEFNRQRDKIINAIASLDADVIGLMEIENDGYDEYSAIADLVNGLNTAVGAGTYAYVDPGVAPVGTDEIAVGLIYKPAVVTPLGATAILDSSVDPLFNTDYNRPALAQSFAQTSDGAAFTVVVNHLKSKGSDCDALGDPDTGDGQGNCNITRTNAATALVNWLATDPTGSGDADFLIIGDLNSYAMEDPITVIESVGYTNLVEAYDGALAYSYVFYGQAGYLDHALANADLAAQVTDTTVWHINADEPSALDYNDYNQPELYSPTPYRSSDHDPVVVGLNLTPPPIAEVGDFVVLGKYNTTLLYRAEVLSGDVGTNLADNYFPRSYLADVILSYRVEFLDPESRVLGDTVLILRTAKTYDVYYNKLINQGIIQGDEITPLNLPLVEAMPAVPAFTPGTQNVYVLPRRTLTLPPGDYGKLSVFKDATVVLTGGDYTFESWVISMKGEVVFQAPSNVNVAGHIYTGDRVYIGPAASASGVTAADIRIIATGPDQGGLKATHFGDRNEIVANVYVPNGLLWIGSRSQATGAFIGKVVLIGDRVTLEHDSGW